MAGMNDLAKKAGLKDEQVKALTDAITKITKSGDSIILKGFGTFKTVTKAARTGRNPITGDEISIPAKTSLHFKPAKQK